MTDEQPSAAAPGRNTRRWVNVAIVAVFAALILIFAFQNTEDAEVDWFFWSVTSPLALVIFASAIAGFLLGAGVVLLRRRRRREA